MDGTIKRGHTNRVLLNVQVEPEFWRAILNAFGARQRLSWIPFQKCFTFFSQSSLHFALNDGFSCLSLCLPLFFTGNIKPERTNYWRDIRREYYSSEQMLKHLSFSYSVSVNIFTYSVFVYLRSRSRL